MTELGRKALKGDQNQCPTCGAYFTTTSGFERHRLGSFNDPEDPRRCVDPSTRKMHLNSAGFWAFDAKPGFKYTASSTSQTVQET